MTPEAMRRAAKGAMMASIVMALFAVVSLTADLGIDSMIFIVSGLLFVAGLAFDRAAARRDGNNF